MVITDPGTKPIARSLAASSLLRYDFIVLFTLFRMVLNKGKNTNKYELKKNIEINHRMDKFPTKISTIIENNETRMIQNLARYEEDLFNTTHKSE
jgi:hypothetical protein